MPDTNAFSSVIVTPNYHLGHIIEWRLDPLFNDDLPYKFSVELSVAYDFSDIVTTIEVEDSFFAIDNTHTKVTKGDSLRYRVKLETSQGTYYSQQIGFYSNGIEKRKYLMASEIQRKELLRIERYVCTEGFLLKRRIQGEKDEDNISFVSGVPLTYNSSDYGTGIKGGYYNPVGLLWSVEDADEKKVISNDNTNLKEPYDLTIRTIGFPQIEENDVLITRDEDIRYIVTSREGGAEFPGLPFKIIQIVKLNQIPFTDKIYQIPIPNEYLPIYYRK